ASRDKRTIHGSPMTEQISDQISAFIDDELSDEESAFLLRRFERDTDARSRAARYTMIGAALRDELVGSDPEILRRRIAVAAIVGLRAVNFARVGVPGAATATAPLQARTSDPAPSYVVPRDVSDAPVVIAPAVRLTNYVMHHSEYASRLSRLPVHSNVVGAGELLPPAETVPAKRETTGE